MESFSRLLKAGKFRHSLHRPAVIVRKLRVRNSRQISIFETDERTHYPAFAECVCAEKRSEFCHPGKTRIRLSKNLAQRTTRHCPATTKPIRIGRSSARNQRGQRPRELLPAPTLEVVRDCQHTASPAFVNGVLRFWRKFCKRTGWRESRHLPAERDRIGRKGPRRFVRHFSAANHSV